RCSPPPPGRAAPPPPRHGGLPWLPGEARPLLELPPERLDLVPQVGRVLEAELLGGLEHVLLELDDLALDLVLARAGGDRRLRPPAAARLVRALDARELARARASLHDTRP